MGQLQFYFHSFYHAIQNIAAHLAHFINSSLITTEATILRTSPYLSCSFLLFFFFFLMPPFFFISFSLKTPTIFFFFLFFIEKKNPTSHFRKPRKKILF